MKPQNPNKGSENYVYEAVYSSSQANSPPLGATISTSQPASLRAPNADLNNHDTDDYESTPALLSQTRETSPPATHPSHFSNERPPKNPQNHPSPNRFKNWFPGIRFPKRKNSKSTPHNSHSGRRYLRLWWWEAVCCTVTLGALLGITATIYSHEGRPLPHWRYGLTVNAIIFIFTVILKAAAGLVLAEGIGHLKWVSVARPQSLSNFVAHDDASRGPMGAFQLLWKNQYRIGRTHVLPFISSLGALITILVILLDPFSQQIIRPCECDERIMENATIARTSLYIESGTHVGAAMNTIPLPVQNAVYNGLFATQKLDVAFTCRTGNCTFANKYSSVAYCSSCMDATAELKTTVSEEFYPDLNQSLTITNVTLQTEDGEVTLSRGGLDPGSGFLGLVSSAYSEIGIIRCDGASNTLDEDQTVRGYRCRLFPCLKTFAANISTGKLEERILEENHDVSATAETALSMADLDCVNNPEQREILKRLGYEFNETTRWLPYNVSLTGLSDPGKNSLYIPSIYDSPCKKESVAKFSDLCNGNKTTSKANEAVPTRCIYNVGLFSAMSLQNNLFTRMFTGTVRNYPNYQYPGFQGNDALMAIYNAGSGNGTLEDLQGIMRNVTDTLTTHMRRASDSKFSEPAKGEMYEHTTCVRVRWGWLSYAATVVGLLLLFFFWMVIFSGITQSRAQIQLSEDGASSFFSNSKSSILPVLFHGLDNETLKYAKDLSVLNQEKGLEKSAKQMTVKMVLSEQGWKLSSVDL